jgi:hypothetical protein
VRFFRLEFSNSRPPNPPIDEQNLYVAGQQRRLPAEEREYPLPREFEKRHPVQAPGFLGQLRYILDEVQRNECRNYIMRFVFLKKP